MDLLNTNLWNQIRYTLYMPIYDIAGRLFTKQRIRSIELLNILPGKRLLIIGAGTGLDLELLPKNIDVTAIDITPAMVDRIKARSKRLGINSQAYVMDGHHLQFEDEQFDYVILHLILAVIPDPYKCISEAERVLKRDGRAVIMDKFLPDGEKASTTRKIINQITGFLFSDINRKVREILKTTSFKLEHEEAAGFGENLRIVLISKQ